MSETKLNESEQSDLMDRSVLLINGQQDCPPAFAKVLDDNFSELVSPPCSPIVATVEWIRGNRFVSDFMANAGLGLSGVGVRERVKITYKPGEVVDEARVLKAVNHMIREADETRSDVKISCPIVISISGANTHDMPPEGLA